MESDEARQRLRRDAEGYPRTFPARTDSGIDRPEIFEPALLHYRSAFRLGDPEFQGSDLCRDWLTVRSRVIDHILRLVQDCAFKSNLVLRGSLLLKAWLGDKARTPGDIDWVYTPDNVGLQDRPSILLFRELTEKIRDNPIAGSASIDAAKAAVDDIWTYERAAGRRIVVPWHTRGLPSGEVQMDVVFGEKLLSEPVETEIPSSIGESIRVRSAGKELSLAWKLMWLETDNYPQGKDLYDATLLAEQTRLPYDLLLRVLNSSGQKSKELCCDFPLSWQVDWDNFKREYPSVEGDVKDWLVRLTKALAPTFQAKLF